MALQQADALTALLADQDLRSTVETTRLEAASRLRMQVEVEAREMSTESFKDKINKLNKNIMSMVSGSDVNEKLAAIAVIDALIDMPYAENETKNIRFANYLKMVLQQSDPEDGVLLKKTAQTLGHLARAGGTLTTDLVEFEIKRSLEWLEGPRTEHRRLAAVLVLKALVDASPTLFNPYIDKYLKLIWTTVSNPKLHVRTAAVESLRSVLTLIAKRDNKKRTEYYNKMYSATQQGFKTDKPDAIHGSLMIIGEMLRNSGEFMLARFKDVCERVLQYKDFRNDLVRDTVITLLPKLAEFCPEVFVRQSLNTCVDHIITVLRGNAPHRDLAFTALGELAVAVGQRIVPKLKDIVDLVKETLDPSSKRTFSHSALTCVSLLAKAVGDQLDRDNIMTGLVEQMFSAGLGAVLVEALAELTTHIPALLPRVRKRLLHSIASILCMPAGSRATTPVRRSSIQVLNLHRGHSLSITGRASMGSRPNLSRATTEESKTELIQLALHTLSTFNFEHVDTEYVEAALGYLDHPNDAVRKQAAETSATLVLRDDQHSVQGTARKQQRYNAAVRQQYVRVVVQQLLERLLTMALTDPLPAIRLSVLKALDSRFDTSLAQPENLYSLFTALNDEDSSVRQTAIATIGRIACSHPAAVLPSLRKTVVQLLTEVEYESEPQSRKDSTILVGCLIDACPELMKPYVNTFLKVFIPRLSDENSDVATTVLGTLGKVAQIGSADIMPFFDELLHLILRVLQTKNSKIKHDVALCTLGLLIRSSAQVIEPYSTYPSLMPTILQTLTLHKGSQGWPVRREAIKVIGVLGALDPFSHKNIQAKHAQRSKTAQQTSKSAPQERAKQQDLTPTGKAESSVSSSDEYFPTVAINALIRILREPGLSNHHTQVVQALKFIYTNLGPRAVPFLPKLIPALLWAMREYDEAIRQTLFSQLLVLVSVVRESIRQYVPDIMGVIHEFWGDTNMLSTHILPVVEILAHVLQTEFKVHLPDLIPKMLSVVRHDRTKHKQVTMRVLEAVMFLGPVIEDYVYLLVPSMLSLVDQRIDQPEEVTTYAVSCIGKLCLQLDFLTYGSRLVHPLSRVLRDPHASQKLRMAVMDTLCCLAYTQGARFAIFVPVISNALSAHAASAPQQQRLSHEGYNSLVDKILHSEPLEQDDLKLSRPYQDGKRRYLEMKIDHAPEQKLQVQYQMLQKAWRANQLSTKEDWIEWMRVLSVELLKTSPSYALRTCCMIAQKYTPLSRELLNAAFMSCWVELPDQYKDDLLRSIENAFESPHIPVEILQVLLNLAEFMERDNKPLPIDVRILGRLAEKCHAYAKALHYKEVEFEVSPRTTIEALISINNQLGLPEAAVGVLHYARKHHSLEVKESWYEKLQRWEDALEAYERKQLRSPDSPDVTFGRMRCLRALGEWERLSQLSSRSFDTSHIKNEHVAKQVAPLGAYASWQLGFWESMDRYLGAMDMHSSEAHFYQAVLAAHLNKFDDALVHIDRTRVMLDNELTALVGESYNRAYRVVVQVQQLAELEEVISYKQSNNAADRARIRTMWSQRLKGCQRDVDVWQQMLAVRSIVVSPKEDIPTWLKFSSLCRKSGRMALSLKVLTSLLGVDADWAVNGNASDADNLIRVRAASARAIESSHPRVNFAYCKHLWAAGFQSEALRRLKSLVGLMDTGHIGTVSALSAEDTKKLQAKCYLKLGNWQLAVREEMDDQSIPEVLGHFSKATELDSDSYKVWHSWAVMNFRVIQHYQLTSDTEKIKKHLVPAIKGFFHSIELASDQGLQDILRLLTLWFTHGEREDVSKALAEGFNTISIGTWLPVIPQIIARIDTTHTPVRQLIHDLLCKIGASHPQSLIYPLTVASKSSSASRQQAALVIMNSMRHHSQSLVDQALLVSHELIRVAILWHEMWHEALEEASRLWFGQRNFQGMLDQLEPLHDVMKAGPNTLREVAFNQAFGRDLEEAYEWCQKYQLSNNETDLNEAWDLYCGVFRAVNKQLTELTHLELQYASPPLLKARDFELAVPGTYRAASGVVNHIAYFEPSLKVIESKQRPRKLSIRGSDGVEYEFLLKGHEDLRQDERVMQLFTLVNALFNNEHDTAKKDLGIRGYAVVPLAPNSGLIQWLGHCDTLHALIKDYRDARNVLLNIEHRLMQQLAPDYAHLTVMQKVEVFEFALANTTGQDLYQVLWLKSVDSETWLDRRTNYTRSLSVMSMVGYILGLGDRHPCNLMLDRRSGKMIHIDFGDCFEVAMNREKFPEKVPFRLTRMLVNAMEVSGIEGNYRSTCESVMRVLRDNKESVMAVLEAFVYDPLINWRLLNTKTDFHGSPQEDGKFNTQADNELDSEVIASSISSAAQGVSAVSTASRVQTVATLESKGVDSAIDSAAGGSEVLNEKALEVLSRIESKLKGRDFDGGQQQLDVNTQVHRLLQQATSHINLCQSYIGWCPYW